MRINQVIILITLVGFPGIMYSQGEINDQEKIFFKDESTFGAMLNSNGFGVNYRYAKRQNAFKATVYDADLVRTRHEKERKQNRYSTNNTVYGQMNSLLTLRTGLGLQKEIFSKRDVGSVRILYFYSAGLSSGFVKPVYHLLITNENTEPDKVRFDIENGQHIPAQAYVGKASYFYKVNETKYVPGIYAKFGFSFEFSQNEKIINALEGAIGVDMYARPIEIMATHTNFLFPSFIFTYRFGKAVDKKTQRSRNAIDKMVDIQ